MTTEPKVIKEIQDIRERMCGETKDVTAKEYNARVRARSQALLARYGIELEKSLRRHRKPSNKSSEFTTQKVVK